MFSVDIWVAGFIFYTIRWNIDREGNAVNFHARRLRIPPMAKKLNIAIAGLGRAGWSKHFNDLKEAPDFQLVAVIDPLPERLEEAAALSGCRTYTTTGAFWRKERPDVLVVATPTRFHERHARKALREGCHVILEKPMTTTLKSADRIVDEAQRHGRRVLVYQPHRLSAETQILKGILNIGILGPVYLIRRCLTRYVRRNDWQSLRKHGGGMLNNYGAHYIDQLLYLSDATPVADIRCNLWAVATRGDADDVVKVWLKTEGNQLLDLEINHAAALPHSPWHICGRDGTLVQSENAFHIRYYDPDRAPELEVFDGAAPGRSYDNRDRLPWQEKTVAIRPDAQLDFYTNIYETFARNAEPHVKTHESRELIRVIEQCRKRAVF